MILRLIGEIGKGLPMREILCQDEGRLGRIYLL
jgi:hypothetical protein